MPQYNRTHELLLTGKCEKNHSLVFLHCILGILALDWVNALYYILAVTVICHNAKHKLVEGVPGMPLGTKSRMPCSTILVGRFSTGHYTKWSSRGNRCWVFRFSSMPVWSCAVPFLRIVKVFGRVTGPQSIHSDSLSHMPSRTIITKFYWARWVLAA